MTDFTALAERLRTAKEIELQAREQRINVEREIYGAALAEGYHFPEKGTTHLGPIKVATIVAVSWDQEKLDALHETFPLELWPFNAVWKEDGRAMTVLAELHPNEYRRLQYAMTTRPRKPQFSLGKGK